MPVGRSSSTSFPAQAPEGWSFADIYLRGGGFFVSCPGRNQELHIRRRVLSLDLCASFVTARVILANETVRLEHYQTVLAATYPSSGRDILPDGTRR
jgi:hypothetical protein